MPEGDTIHRAAARLRAAINGERITEVAASADIPNATVLVGRIVTGVEARAKHLLIHLSDNYVVHSHLGMNGSWRMRARQKSESSIPGRVWLMLATAKQEIVCQAPKLLKIITSRELLRDRYLQKLGPDLLGPQIPNDVLTARFRTQRCLPIGEVIMNQTVVSGIGNVYKSELLFLEQIHPQTPVNQLRDSQIISLCERAVALMRRNLGQGKRRTRFRPDRHRLWVYGRQGERCLRCGDTIEVIRQGSLNRSTSYCPSCQPSP